MRTVTQLLAVCLLFIAIGFTQTIQPDPEASDAIATGKLGFSAGPAVDLATVPGAPTSNTLTFDAVTGNVISGAAAGNNNIPVQAAQDISVGAGNMPNNPTIDGLNTVATFDGSFAAQGGPNLGQQFRFTMVGNDPRLGQTTKFPAILETVTWKLLNADGSTRAVVSYDPFEQLTLESPNFEPLDYRSGVQVQYADAFQRAQFFNIMKSNWHTVLQPTVVNRITFTVPKFINVRLSNGTVVQARAYFLGTGPDGTPFVEMLDLLLNFFLNQQTVNEIIGGNFETNALNTFLLPNTFIFSLNVNNPNRPGSCCTLGFHTFFFKTNTVPQPRWLRLWASWFAPGVFPIGTFQDITVLTHEVSEAIADPFLDNPTPNWDIPNFPTVCQNNLEVGDPVVGIFFGSPSKNLWNVQTVDEGTFSFDYHPENLVLYQWFSMGSTSSAIDGAFSFPDETAVPTSAHPCGQ